jgi:AcrR family transcriptional regulator
MNYESPPSGPGRKTGRPLSYSREVALKQAMLTFWRYGYETTSIVDLTSAMGVTAPSLYTAFGDKRRLFLEAVQLYAGDPDALARAMETAATAHDAVRDMLRGAAIAFTGDETPRGCLLASATASGSAASADVQHAIAEIRRGIDALLRRRIERDIAAGLLPAQTDAAVLSSLVMAVTQGMSVLARDGACRTLLLGIADHALRGWPKS